MRLLLLFLSAQLFSYIPLTAQQIWHVRAQAQGTGTGQDWLHAFSNLQDALAISVAGDEIWVAQGVYKPTDDDDRARDFTLQSGVRLYGGFAGTETSLSQRNVSLNETVLSGDIGIPGDSTDNSYHVLTGVGLDATTILDGFTIRDGYGIPPDNIPVAVGGGGGLMVTGIPGMADCRLQVRNCRFVHNTAEKGGAVYVTWKNEAYGGTCYVNPAFVNCTFERNHAIPYDGGAVSVVGANAPGDTMLFSDCIFRENLADIHFGGGLSFRSMGGATVRIQRTLFERDSCWVGGGLSCLPDYQDHKTINLELDSCIFRYNNAQDGGGMSYDAYSFLSKNIVFNCKMTKCVFEGNFRKQRINPAFKMEAIDSSVINLEMYDCIVRKNNGTRVCWVSSYRNGTANVKVSNCEFRDNKPINPGLFDALVFMINGHYDNNKAEISFNNCLFANNNGCMAFTFSEKSKVQATITNCTFFSNNNEILIKSWYPSYEQPGTPYYNKMKIRNTLFWEPKTDGYYFLYNNNPDNLNYKQFDIDYVSWNLWYSDFVFPGPELQGPHNHFGTYPGFVDTLSGDFRLLPCSPLVNAGINNEVLSAVDVSGAPRVRFGTVDLGCYEAQDSCQMVNTGTREETASLSVSPNPSAGELTVHTDGVGSGTLVVFNSAGQAVIVLPYSDGFTTKNETISTQGWASGIYYIQLRTAVGIRTVRWVKY